MNARQLRKSRSMKKSVRLLRSRDVKGPQFDPLIEDLEKTIERIDDVSGKQRSA